MPTATATATTTTPTSTPPTSSSTTLRHPPYTYLHISFISPSSAPTTPASAADRTPIDAITARATLHRALSTALGLHGAAIPLDVLHVRGRECWVRVPREDGKAVSAALMMGAGGGGKDGGGKEMGIWVRGRGCTLGAVLVGDGDGAI